MLLNKLKITTAVCLLAVLTSCGAAVLKTWAAGQIESAKGTAVTQPKLPDCVSKKAATDSAKTVNPPITGTPLRAGPPRVLVEHKSPLTCLAWSPDGRWVAASTEDGTILVTEVATGKEVRSFPVGAAITALAFSPDGKRLALSQPGRPSSIWDIDAGKEQPSAGGRGGGGRKIEAAARAPVQPDRPVSGAKRRGSVG